MKTAIGSTKCVLRTASKVPRAWVTSSPITYHHQQMRRLRASTLDRTLNTTEPQENEDFPQGQINWSDHWYPLQIIEDLDPKKPNAFQLLGKGIVVWYDAKGANPGWKAFRDLCPHRLIPLSEGRVNEKGMLECGYHGWEFNGSGACEHIPQAQPGSVGHKSSRACVEAYPCVIKQGLIWVKPVPIAVLEARGGLREEDIPTVPEVDDSSYETRTVMRELPYDYGTLMENLSDISHVSFTHHGTIGNRKSAQPMEMKVETRSVNGYTGAWPAGPVGRGGKKVGPMLTEFQAPATCVHRIDGMQTVGFAGVTAFYAIPTSPGRSKIIARFPTKAKSGLIMAILRLMPQWMDHLKRSDTLEDDQLFLHYQERDVQQIAQETGKTDYASMYYYATAADAHVNAFRKWVMGPGRGGPFGSPLTQKWAQEAGPRMSQDQLLERYHSHTKNCKHCSAALKNFTFAENVLQLISPVLVLLASFAAATAAATSAGAAVPFAFLAAVPAPQLWLSAGWAAAAGLAAWLVAAYIANFKQRFLKGTYPPPRNN